MIKTLRHTMKNLLGSAIVAAGLAAGAVHAEDKSIKIGWTAWSDCEATTQIAKQILEQKLGYKVELVLADIGLQYQGVAKGDTDVMLMAWLPTTHQNYWAKFKDQVVDLGILYDNAKLGWAVPTYIPESELKSITDLTKPEVKKQLKGTIQGIDPGAGLTQASEKVIKAYELGYHLQTASDAAMVAALDRAVKRKEWIVVTTWSPHWMFAQYPLRYLDEPKGVMGGAEAIHAVSRKGFETDHPSAAAFIKNLKLPLSDLEAIMLKAKSTSFEKEAAAYIAANPDKVAVWLKGVQ